jgi:hypothetical protein
MANPNPYRKPAKLYTAFGETKSIPEWAEDERCVCSYAQLRARVQQRGWDIEVALTKPIGPYYRKGERKLKPKRKPKPQGHMVSAWGLTMSLKAWSEQSYVPVSVATLWRRIVRDGWPPEKALRLKPGTRYIPPPKPPLEMSLGEYLVQGLTKFGPRRKLHLQS